MKTLLDILLLIPGLIRAGIGPNDFIDLFNCELLSKTKIQDIS